MSDTSDNGNGGRLDTVTDELRKVVFQIDPNCPYPTWFQVGCALHSEFGDGGFQVFNDWSATATKPGHYPGRHGCWSQWVNCRRYTAYAKGTLYHWRRECPAPGYIEEKRERAERPVVIPTAEDRICVRCGANSAQDHHWAPRALFPDFDLWPKDWLCKSCHDRWHETVGC